MNEDRAFWSLFASVGCIAILFNLALIAAVVVAIVLAWKNWG